MADSIQKLGELKRKIENARSKSERAAGSLQQILSTLKKDWGCSTIEEACEKLAALKKKAAKKEAEFLEMMSTFERTWGEQLK